MSKSLGNFFTVKDLLDQGVPGEVMRFVLLSTHYRSPMDWTQDKARRALETLRIWVNDVTVANGQPDKVVVNALADDLNTSLAITRLHELHSSGQFGPLTQSANLLGFDLLKLKSASWTKPFEKRELIEGLDFRPSVGMVGWGHFDEETVSEVLTLIRSWMSLRWEKNWEQADNVKKMAKSVGLDFSVDKSENGYDVGTATVEAEFHPSKLEALK